MSTNQPSTPPADKPPESVWRYRGYNLRASEFTTAMVHYYRAEIQRSNAWRQRLDATTNWAVIAAGAAISFALSSPANHYGVIILDTLLITLFVWIEARRYRYYELWSYRARLMETDFFAAMLVPPFEPNPEWGESLAQSLLQPEFPISMWEAFGRRFRRNYMWIYLVLAFAWALKSFLHPVPATTVQEFIARSALGGISGEAMIIAGVVFNGILFLIGLITTALHESSGEVLPKFQIPGLDGLVRAMEHPMDHRPEVRTPRRRRRQQILALIITDQPQAVADQVLKEMKRGVTALHGQGMYTQQAREVLMVALTVTEMAHLKTLVKAQDPNAFVVVAPAQEVLGRGFQPLNE
jgi:uncharacterized membrane protein